MMYVDKYFAERGHLIHKLKAKDSTGRWAYYFVYVKPDLEQAFLKALESGQIIDLEDYGKVIGSCYGEKPSKQLRSFLKEKYGFDVQSSSINLKKVIMNKEALLVDSFRKVFESMNQEGIKESVDKNGIDRFISDCALLAATTGAATGFGGFSTMIVGVPVDVINNVVQQFRVTLGVIYHKKGVYKVSFSQFMKIVGVSLGVEIGASLTKSVMFSIANKILIRLTASTAGKAVPFIGAFIGGSVNYGFIRAIGAAVKQIDMSSMVFEEDVQQNSSADEASSCT